MFGFIRKQAVVMIGALAIMPAHPAGGNQAMSATGECVNLCAVPGLSKIKTATGYEVDLFATKNTAPALVVERDGQRCYADLVAGNDTGINILYTDGNIYHTQAPGECIDYPVIFVPAGTSTRFDFTISAAGTFYVNCGNGDALQVINKTNTASQTITCNYTDAASNHTVKLNGAATGYSTDTSTGAIQFNGTAGIQYIDGCLGCVFGTLSNGTQPRFYQTFYNNTALTYIPDTLFNGVSGAPTDYMFAYTFYNTGITSIPESLFGGIQGAPTDYMFFNTFSLSQITFIPETLLSGIQGAPADSMFRSTFEKCYNLTSIPAGLFNGIRGAPAPSMYRSTFHSCNRLTGSIPDNLFGEIFGAPQEYMFSGTFYDCNRLTGSIPDKLFGEFDGAPAQWMFASTFSRCSGLTGSIPENLFSGIVGTPAPSMFQQTFYSCSKLSGSIPADIFAGISTTDSYRSSMFYQTFLQCTSLTGYSPKIDGKYIYQIWPSASSQGTYEKDSGLTDYSCIPTGWGGSGSKEPGQCEPTE